MPSFRVHYEAGGRCDSATVQAASPADARAALAKSLPGAVVIIHKVKHDRSAA